MRAGSSSASSLAANSTSPSANGREKSSSVSTSASLAWRAKSIWDRVLRRRASDSSGYWKYTASSSSLAGEMARGFGLVVHLEHAQLAHGAVGKRHARDLTFALPEERGSDGREDRDAPLADRHLLRIDHGHAVHRVGELVAERHGRVDGDHVGPDVLGRNDVGFLLDHLDQARERGEAFAAARQAAARLPDAGGIALGDAGTATVGHGSASCQVLTG